MAVSVGTAVPVAVLSMVGVGVPVGSLVAVAVGVSVGVDVAVAVGVAVGVGASNITASRSSTTARSSSGVVGLSGPYSSTRMVNGPE